MFYNFKQHTNTFQTLQNIYIHSTINCFCNLLLRFHYLMAPPGFKPVEGSQRLTSFLVRLLFFRSGAVTYKPVDCVSLLRNVCMCQCVCMCLQSGSYRESIPDLFLFQTLLRIWSHSLPSADCVEIDSRFPCHLWRTNPEFGIGALQISWSLCSSPPHTPFWSWCKCHCRFPSKLVSVPEALKTFKLWRSSLWEPLPPSTTATWKFSSLRPLPLSISAYWACWTVETHRRRILPPTRSRTWLLRGQGWKVVWSCHIPSRVGDCHRRHMPSPPDAPALTNARTSEAPSSGVAFYCECSTLRLF